MNSAYDHLRAALRERVHIADLLQVRGVSVRLNGRGGGIALCPFHDDHRPSLSIYRSRRDDTTGQSEYPSNINLDFPSFVVDYWPIGAPRTSEDRREAHITAHIAEGSVAVPRTSIITVPPRL
jgi:hypothetical protein